jgi:hypothetical protein
MCTAAIVDTALASYSGGTAFESLPGLANSTALLHGLSLLKNAGVGHNCLLSNPHS